MHVHPVHPPWVRPCVLLLLPLQIRSITVHIRKPSDDETVNHGTIKREEYHAVVYSNPVESIGEHVPLYLLYTIQRADIL
jgi:hypothetical protein